MGFRKKHVEEKNIIEFIDVNNDTALEYAPKPAKNVLPDWYKSLEPYIKTGRVIPENEMTSASLKRCVPVFDALSAGYIIFTSVDVQVTTSPDGQKYFKWPRSDIIAFHGPEQVGTYPLKNVPKGQWIPKYKNPWGVRTPPGYSTLFLNPIHRDRVITIMEGLVDTDTYHDSVHFPFTLNDYSWEGIIEAGTPLAQAIPIKRDDFTHLISRDNDLLDNPGLETNYLIRSSFFDGYRKKFWSRKNYN